MYYSWWLRVPVVPSSACQLEGSWLTLKEHGWYLPCWISTMVNVLQAGWGELAVSIFCLPTSATAAQLLITQMLIHLQALNPKDPLLTDVFQAWLISQILHLEKIMLTVIYNVAHTFRKCIYNRLPACCVAYDDVVLCSPRAWNCSVCKHE